MVIFLCLFMVLMSLLVIVLLVQRIERVNSLLADALNDLETAAYRESTTNHKVEEVFLALAPILEQTDWMTGRWGGRLGELIGLEKARNATTVAVRARLLSTPFMIGYFSEHKMPLLTGSLQSAFTGIENERQES